MKEFVLKILLLLPIIFLAIIVNLTQDPANLFSGSQYEQGIASLLLQGSNVKNVSNYDERLVQKYYVNGLTQPKDIVVLGSSRAMMIRSDIFPGRRFFNSSVSGASLEDHIAIYELYHEKKLDPAIVIIAVDPWLLNRYNGQNRWKSLEGEYVAATERFSQSPPPLFGSAVFGAEGAKLLELISPSYFQQSLKALLHYSKPEPYVSTSAEEGETQIKRGDGAISYDQKTRSLSVDEVRRAAISYAEQGSVYSLEKFVSLDADYQKEMDNFLTSLRRENIRVVMLLAPYHPEVYKRLIEQQKYRIIVKAQRFFEELAQRHAIPLLGSFNPADCGCSDADFYDGMHPRESCVRKILGDKDTLFTVSKKPAS
jgi:hypothetical protein